MLKEGFLLKEMDLSPKDARNPHCWGFWSSLAPECLDAPGVAKKKKKSTRSNGAMKQQEGTYKWATDSISKCY